MIQVGPAHFASAISLALAAVIGASAVFVAIARRIRLSLPTASLLLLGLFLLVLAAGEPYRLTPAVQSVTVMVDLSPSTRGAAFRDSGLLYERAAELLGRTPFQIVNFNEPFTPAPADAILLFSGGRFAALSASPPVFPVLDPSLESQADAAITGMELRGRQVFISVTNNGGPRTLTLHGVLGPPTETVSSDQTFTRDIDPHGDTIWAELSGGDLWPENDRAWIRLLPPVNSQRWWIGQTAPDGWQPISPAAVPTDPADYLAPSVIVLDNVAADEIPAAGIDRLDEYVRDLGGSLVILGGDSAFGSGGYEGTELDALSPLASSPPQPASLWILLADASGSMAEDDHWGRMSRLLVQVLPNLPPMDPVRVGQFSDNLRWWSDGRTAKETAALPLPPPDAQPHGPTNLEPVIEAIARDAPKSMPTQLLLITDAGTEIDDPDALSQKLRAANVHLHLLAVDRGEGLPVLEDMVRDTGGVYLTDPNESTWPLAIRQLLAAALPDRLHRDGVAVRFRGSADSQLAQVWDRTWLKPNATPLANAGQTVMAGQWQYGLGQVIAVAFQPSADVAGSLADSIAQPPTDPRISVRWQTGPVLRASVDAINGLRYLNDLRFNLQIRNRTYSIPQTEPGRYEISATAPAEPSIASVWLGNRLIDRTALAGWYPPRFAAVGEDRAALQKLADDTGGKLILPSEKSPIQFPWPAQRHDLTAWLAAGAALMMAMGLIAWRLTPSAGGRLSGSRPARSREGETNSPLHSK